MSRKANGKASNEDLDEWLDYLRSRGRKENTVQTHRNNVTNCLTVLARYGRPTDADKITVDDIHFLWRTLEVKENVRHAYLRSLSNMVEYHTKIDIVKQAALLHNRDSCDRVFITKEQFALAYKSADPRMRLILVLGAYMGLRRAEMAGIRDGDIEGETLTIHGKGHGEDGLMTKMVMPQPVMDAIYEYRRSPMSEGFRLDDHLLQTRASTGFLHEIHPNKISEMVCRQGQELGFHMTTHSLRRFYATSIYYETGCDIQTLRNLMRHASVNTTLKCYVDASEKNEREAKEKLTAFLNGLLDDA